VVVGEGITIRRLGGAWGARGTAWRRLRGANAALGSFHNVDVTSRIASNDTREGGATQKRKDGEGIE
jgi:hypothetical protein